LVLVAIPAILLASFALVGYFIWWLFTKCVCQAGRKDSATEKMKKMVLFASIGLVFVALYACLFICFFFDFL